MSKDEANNGTHYGDISNEGQTVNSPVLQTGGDIGLVSTSDSSQSERPSREENSDKVSVDNKSLSNVSDSGDKSLTVQNDKVDIGDENTSKKDSAENTSLASKENSDENKQLASNVERDENTSLTSKENSDENKQLASNVESGHNSSLASKDNSDENSQQTSNVESVEATPFSSKVDAAENTSLSSKADIVENTSSKVDTAENTSLSSKADIIENTPVSSKEEIAENTSLSSEKAVIGDPVEERFQNNKSFSEEKQSNPEETSKNESKDLTNGVKDNSDIDQKSINKSTSDLPIQSEDSEVNKDIPKHVSFSEPEVIGPDKSEETGKSVDQSEEVSTDSTNVKHGNDTDGSSSKIGTDGTLDNKNSSETGYSDNSEHKLDGKTADLKEENENPHQNQSADSEKTPEAPLTGDTVSPPENSEGKKQKENTEADDGDLGYEDDFEETDPVNHRVENENESNVNTPNDTKKNVDSDKRDATDKLTESLQDSETKVEESVESDKNKVEEGKDKADTVITVKESNDQKVSGESADTQQEGDENDTSNSIEKLEQNIHQAKEDWQKAVTDTDNSESNEITGSQSEQTTEPEGEVTKIIVDDEGIPKVSVTTVPDRPPSSEPEDNNALENTDAAQYDDDNFYDTDDDTKTEKDVETDGKSTEEKDQVVKESDNNTNILTEESDKVDDKTFQQITNSGDLSARSEEAQEGTESENKPDSVTNGHNKFKSESPTNEAENMGDTGEEPGKTMFSEKDTSGKEQNDVTDSGTKETAKSGEGVEIESTDKENSKSVEEKEVKPPTPELKKVESPLEKLLKRNVEIDGSVETITQLEENVVNLLKSMKDVMSHYGERLKLQTLKDITDDMGKFRGDFSSVNDAFKRYSALTQNVNARLKELRYVTEDVKTQISRKFVSEDLSTWIDVTPEQEQEKERLQDEVIAAEKVAMVKAAEARQAMATATVGVAQAQQYVTEMEAQTAEAEAVAIKAEAHAKVSIIAAEEAKKAAEERRIAEEASKKRAEERARVKAEEAKKKAAEEEKLIHMEAAKKGTNVQDEREKFMKEKERKEAERRNPKNWPKYGYKAPGNDFDPSIGCVVRAIDGSMRSGDVDCSFVDQSTDVLKLRENEELVSNIIQLIPTDADKKFSFEEPFSIALPVCFNRVQLGREAVVKQLVANGAWKELPSGDVQFEEHREAKFIEGRTRTFGTFAVVMTLKKDAIQFTNKVGKVVSTVDSRISFTTQKGTFKHVTNGILEVQSFDVNSIMILKQRAPIECEQLLTSSPIIKLQLPEKRLNKSLTVSVPVPSLQQRQARPATAVARPVATEETRPATARPTSTKEEENPEEIRFVYKDEKNGWTANNKMEIGQIKNKDIITLEFQKPFEKFVLLRTKPGVKDANIEKIATLLEKTLTQRNVKVALRQNRDEASEIAIVCTTSTKTNKALQSLEDEGFADGPVPSTDLILMEGQQMYMKFRGNIHCVTDNPSLDFIFNSHIKTIRKFQVMELDVFAQKSIHCYRGFIQVFTKTFVPKPSSDSTQKPEIVEAEVLLTELLVELPKPETEPPKPLRVAPISLNDSPLTHLVFRHLADRLGKEWRELGAHLNLRPTRIQAILRQNVNKETPQTRYDMLVTWAKRIPKGVDKVQILCHALIACGRQDLAEEVRYKGEEFKQQRHNMAKPSHLKQAFVKVAKCQEVFRHWQKFAKRLGVPEDDIKRIEETPGSGQEKCFTSLEQWSITAGDDASIPELSNQLKLLKQPNLSKEVESVVVS